MIKTTYSAMVCVIGFLALMLILPSAHLNAKNIDNPNDSPGSWISNVSQTDIKTLNQLESHGLMAQAEAQAAEEHHCVGHCRHHYEERMRECSEPGHEHHHRCEEWAREREKECLENCYKEYPK
ncbi:MAG: hypothetical protein ABSH41_29010 [Syntrophobacteraceae bacterium]|jgi:hypothetical protein